MSGLRTGEPEAHQRALVRLRTSSWRDRHELTITMGGRLRDDQKRRAVRAAIAYLVRSAPGVVLGGCGRNRGSQWLAPA